MSAAMNAALDSVGTVLGQPAASSDTLGAASDRRRSW